MDIFRFADRDMVMRFYWGAAIGHTYAHAQSSRTGHEDDLSNISDDPDRVVPDPVLENDREINTDELEFTLDVHDCDDWDDVDDGMVDGDDLHDTLGMADELFAPMCDT
jgi:hypothetical protein